MLKTKGKTKSKSKSGKGKLPSRLPDGTVEVCLGMLADADFSGLMIRRDAIDHLGFSPGQWMEIECVSRGTKVTRMLLCSHCEGYDCVRGNYAYMDPVSIQCLGCDLDETVRVKPAEHTFDLP